MAGGNAFRLIFCMDVSRNGCECFFIYILKESMYKMKGYGKGKFIHHRLHHHPPPHRRHPLYHLLPLLQP